MNLGKIIKWIFSKVMMLLGVSKNVDEDLQLGEIKRKLASIREVAAIEPIEGADAIECITVDGWKVVDKKGVHKVGDLVIYCEIDSFLPIREEFEFLRKTSYKKLVDGTEGFRLKTIRLRGQYSNGLIMSIDKLPGRKYKLGDDVTNLLGITKYEPPIPASLGGVAKGNFPNFIHKTDESRLQNMTRVLNTIRAARYYVTEKLDGTSFTCYFHNDVFGVCSRNLDLVETEGNTYWEVARKNDLEVKMRNYGKSIAIQGEIIGDGIQGNRYNIRGTKLFVFNVFDIQEGEYMSKADCSNICKEFGLDQVPVIGEDMEFPDTVDAAITLAEGKCVFNPKSEREGLVWVANDTPKRLSFKTISNKYLSEKKDS